MRGFETSDMGALPDAGAMAEAARLAELASYNLLDTPPEPEYDYIVALARVLFDTPISAVSLVDRDRQWFKAKSGLDSSQTPLQDSFCRHAMRSGDVLVVPDARLDSRFADNNLVVGAPHIRFYAGARLASSRGQDLGALCVISTDSRAEFSLADRKKLELLARIVGNEMELRRQVQQTNQALDAKNFDVRTAQFRIKNSLELLALLAEVQSSETSVEKITAVALAAWKQHDEAGAMLASCLKTLRDRMEIDEYNAILGLFKGFAL